MKKTILSIAVGMASFGAFAADSIADAPVAPAKGVVAQSVENAEVFGKIGVSLDKADKSEFDYLRNTEIGVRTGAKVGHDLTATAEVVANFDNKDEALVLDKVEMGLEHEMGAVHFGKIDDRYDMATTKFDQFEDVFNGTAYELYNATGKRDGVALSASPIAGLGIAVQLDSGEAGAGDIADSKAITATYGIAGIDLAAAYRTESLETETEDQTAYKLGAGYGIAGFYTGLVYESQNDFAETETNVIALSTSYKIDALTLKAGYASVSTTVKGGAKDDAKLMRLAAQYDLHDNVALNAGYAKVDASTDEDLFTAGVVVRF